MHSKEKTVAPALALEEARSAALVGYQREASCSKPWSHAAKRLKRTGA